MLLGLWLTFHSPFLQHYNYPISFFLRTFPRRLIALIPKSYLCFIRQTFPPRLSNENISLYAINWARRNIMIYYAPAVAFSFNPLNVACGILEIQKSGQSGITKLYSCSGGFGFSGLAQNEETSFGGKKCLEIRAYCINALLERFAAA